MLVPDSRFLVPLPDGLDPVQAAPLTDAALTPYHAVKRSLPKLAPGSSAVVIGAGGVGLNAVQGARIVGAMPIVALDLLESKLAAARRFGATHALHAGRDDVAQAVRELTAGRGADYVFVTVGSAEAVVQALDLVRNAGTVVLVGIPPAHETITVPVSALRQGERRIVGCAMGSTRLQVDVPRLVALHRDGRLKLDELISARYPLARINEALAAVERGDVLRNVIVFD